MTHSGDGFTIVPPTQTTLAPNASTSLVVVFTADDLGDHSGALIWSSNDPAHSTFQLSLSGAVTEVPHDVRVVDDGDAGFKTEGVWHTAAGQGWQDGVHYAASGNGQSSAEWTFDDVPAGFYRVSATWSAHANRTSNAPFTLFDGSQPVTTVAVDQRVAPAGLNAGGAGWHDLGTLELTSGTLTVRLTNQADGWVIADAVRIERVPAPVQPPLSLLDGGSAVAAGGLLQFPDALQTAAASKTLTVRNTGTHEVVLADIADVPAGFAVSSFGTHTLAPGASTSFVLTLDTQQAGLAEFQ